VDKRNNLAKTFVLKYCTAGMCKIGYQENASSRMHLHYTHYSRNGKLKLYKDQVYLEGKKPSRFNTINFLK